MEFYKADKFLKQKQTNVSIFKSHPQAYRLLDFTTKLNETLDQEDMRISSKSFGNYYDIC